MFEIPAHSIFLNLSSAQSAEVWNDIPSGSSITLKVLKKISSQQYLILINKQKTLADSKLSLIPGEKYQAAINRNGQALQLKILNPEHLLLGGFSALSSAVLKNLKLLKNFFDIEKNSSPAEAVSLEKILAKTNKDLNSVLADPAFSHIPKLRLFETILLLNVSGLPILKNNITRALNYTPQTIGEILTTLLEALEKADPLTLPAALKNFYILIKEYLISDNENDLTHLVARLRHDWENSGLFYERKIFSQSPKLNLDLKYHLLYLSEGLSDNSATNGFDRESVIKSLLTLLHHIEFLQLKNNYWSAEQVFFFQWPIMLDKAILTITLQLKLLNHKKNSRWKNFVLTLKVPTTRLGLIIAIGRFQQQDMSWEIRTESTAAASFLAAHLDQIRKACADRNLNLKEIIVAVKTPQEEKQTGSPQNINLTV